MKERNVIGIIFLRVKWKKDCDGNERNDRDGNIKEILMCYELKRDYIYMCVCVWREIKCNDRMECKRWLIVYELNENKWKLKWMRERKL